MGTGFSRKRKPENGNEDKDQHQLKPVCCSCGNDGAVQPKRDTKAGSSDVQVLNLEEEGREVQTNQQEKRFYYYPQKDPAEDETLYVTTSQFPYARPKAVVVRQHVVDGVSTDDTVFPKRAAPVASYQTSVYPKLNAALQEHLGVNDGKRPPYQAVNDRRWSTPNVVPSSGFMPEKVLPHRTVAELRRNSLNIPSYDHYERYYSYNYQIGGSNRRPPTPSPTAWYPARRSNDYLVASSLLGMERTRDRIRTEKKTENQDAHRF